MRIVPVNSLTSGVMVGHNIHSDTGEILLKRGVILTDSLIERIIANGIFTIYIEEGYTDQAIEDIIRPEVRQRALQAIRETFANIAKSQDDFEPQGNTLTKQLQNKSMEKYISKLRNVCEFIVDDISNSKQLMINLVDIKNLNSHLYQHSLSVAIMATVVGIEMKLDKHQLYNLFLGAVLHDVGKLFIPKEIISQTTPLSTEDRQLLKRHARLGYNYLKENYVFEAPARIIALQHHEYYNGEGYPKGTSGENLHLFSRIVSLCNHYDNLVSDTPQSKATSAHEAYEFLMGTAGRMFDFKVVEIFTRKVNPYPIGTLVKLSNGVNAVVIRDTHDFPLRPLLQEVDLKKRTALANKFDLMQATDLTIVGVL